MKLHQLDRLQSCDAYEINKNRMEFHTDQIHAIAEQEKRFTPLLTY